MLHVRMLHVRAGAQQSRQKCGHMASDKCRKVVSYDEDAVQACYFCLLTKAKTQHDVKCWSIQSMPSSKQSFVTGELTS